MTTWKLTRGADGALTRLDAIGDVRALAQGKCDSMGRLPIRMLASTETVNSFGFIVDNSAFNPEALLSFNANPVLLAFHRIDQPVGKAPARLTEEGLVAEGWVSSGRPDIQQFVLDGTVSGVSIGFMPTGETEGDDGITHITGLELMEITLCAAGSNPDAFVEPAALTKLVDEVGETLSKEPIPSDRLDDDEVVRALMMLGASASGLSVALARMAVSSAEHMMGGMRSG